MQVHDGIITFTDGVSISFLQVGGMLVFDVVIGIVGEEIAKAKGRSRLLWLMLCCLFPPLVIMLLTLEGKPRQIPAAAARARSPSASVRPRRQAARTGSRSG